MREPTIHDYTSQYWGHTISYKPTGNNHDVRGVLFGQNVRIGDYLILPNGEGTTRYKITESNRYSDPGDQYAFTAAFAPRHAVNLS